MFTEGFGYVIPKSISVILNEEETRTTRAYATYLSQNKGYIFDNCLIGLLGEAALAKHILKETGVQRAANWELYDNTGDGGIDISISGLTIQVKTRNKGRVNRIPRMNNGKFTPLNSQLYTFCQVIEYSLTFALVNILGWIEETELQQHGKMNKRQAGVWYLEIESKYLYPMPRLIQRIKNVTYQVSRQQRKTSIHHR